MNGSQLRAITYQFPTTTTETKAFFTAFAAIFAQAAGAAQQPAQITLTPTNPPASLPLTVLQGVATDFPQIVFETEQAIDLHFGVFHLCSMSITTQQREPAAVENLPTATLLPIEEFQQRLDGHITHVDHTGVNLPVARLDRDEWEALLQQLGPITNLYAYPTGEDWPFIIPATTVEFQDDIQHFVAGRAPKFELVYDGWTAQPLLQFALGTDLTRPQLETLLPEPYGWAIPELAQIFRSVLIAHPWPGLQIRFDLYYRNEEGVSDWDTGEWLVKEGGRIQ